MPRLNSCSITLTQDGKPLQGAMVRLQSGDPVSPVPWIISGKTDGSGVATILTQGRYNGAPAGTFKVVVVKEERVDIETPAQAAAREKREAAGNLDYHPLPYELVDLVEEQYRDPETTPLEITVVNGKNSQSYEVGKAVRISKGITTPE